MVLKNRRLQKISMKEDFIHSSTVSLKAVLIHKANKYPSVLLTHATNINKKDTKLEVILKKIEYCRYEIVRS